MVENSYIQFVRLARRVVGVVAADGSFSFSRSRGGTFPLYFGDGFEHVKLRSVTGVREEATSFLGRECHDFFQVVFAANPCRSGEKFIGDPQPFKRAGKELTVGRLQFFEVVEMLSGQGPDAFLDQERNSVFLCCRLDLGCGMCEPNCVFSVQ